jgi:hypothetical protein
MKVIPLNLICTFLLIVNCKLFEENNIQTLYIMVVSTDDKTVLKKVVLGIEN